MSKRIELPVEEIVGRYEGGESTWILGRAYGVSQYTVWNRLYAAGVKMRRVGFQLGHKCGLKRGGPLYVDGKGYLRTLDREGKACRVHRGCWEAYHGAIPADHDIHHVNGNPLDNRVENLDCMSHVEHTRHHHRRDVRNEGLLATE